MQIFRPEILTIFPTIFLFFSDFLLIFVSAKQKEKEYGKEIQGYLRTRTEQKPPLYRLRGYGGERGYRGNGDCKGAGRGLVRL